MTILSTKTFCLLLLAGAGILAACSSSNSGASGGDNCTSLCSAAQAGNCTTIKGNCSSFCASLAVVYPPAGCTNQYNAYESCLEPAATICSQECGAQAAALSSCVQTYCAGRTSDTNCTTVAGSF